MIVEDHPGTIDSLPERYMMNTQIAKANAIKWKVFLMIWPILMAF